MLHQVECLIYDDLLPMPVSRLRVSENFLLEKVTGADRDGHPKLFTVAYLAIDPPKETRLFLMAGEYLDLFLLVWSLTSRRGPSHRFGAASGLDDMSSLGNSRVTWPQLKRPRVQGEEKYDLSASVWGKPILETRRLFLDLLPDRSRILEGYLGLALRFHYLAGSERMWNEKLVLLMIAAEALLIKGKKEFKSMTLARRMPSLISERKREKEKISREMKKLYKLRNAIVHGEEEGKKASLRDVIILFDYLGRALRKCLRMRELSKPDLVTRLDEAESPE